MRKLQKKYQKLSTEYGIKLSSVVKRGPNRLLSPAFLLIWYRQMIVNCREKRVILQKEQHHYKIMADATSGFV